MDTNKDTIRLLRECQAGDRMGIDSFDDIIGKVESKELKEILRHSRERHCQISDEIGDLLEDCHDEGKKPPVMAEMMARLKAGFNMMGDEPDRQAARFITDGCHMGVKSICEYFNKYPAADVHVKRLVDKIVREEEGLMKSMRKFV